MRKTLRCAVILGSMLAGNIVPGRTQEPPLPAEFRDTPPALQLLTKQWSNFPAAAPAYTLEFLRSADRESVKLSLKDAILIGLKNNPGIEVERLEPTRIAEQTFGEKSIFDPTLNFEFGKDYSVDPFGLAASPFFQPVQTNQNRDWNLSVNKFFITGTQLELSFRNNYFVGSLPNQVLKPQYQPRLGLAMTQPLLRGFGWGLTTIFVRISENREEVSLLGYRAKLAQLIQRITEAYWAVTYATENVRVQEKAIELADALLRDAEAKVRAGLFPSIAVTEARAERVRREEQVIVARANLDIARADLRSDAQSQSQSNVSATRRGAAGRAQRGAGCLQSPRKSGSGNDEAAGDSSDSIEHEKPRIPTPLQRKPAFTAVGPACRCGIDGHCRGFEVWRGKSVSRQLWHFAGAARRWGSLQLQRWHRAASAIG